jgi:hypothetical protein
LRRPAGFADAADRYADLPDAQVVREYPAEVTTMIGASEHFDVIGGSSSSIMPCGPITNAWTVGS